MDIWLYSLFLLCLVCWLSKDAEDHNYNNYLRDGQIYLLEGPQANICFPSAPTSLCALCVHCQFQIYIKYNAHSSAPKME